MKFAPFFFLCAILVLAACSAGYETPKPDAAAASGITEVVARHGDCSIFRTMTIRRDAVHWVRCVKEPRVVESEVVEACGKKCTRHVKTTTVEEVQ